jgi:hypothetical protein
MISDLQSYTLPAAQMPPGWLIGPRSFLMDRFAPECERIALPARGMPGADIRFGLRTTTDPDPFPLHWLKYRPRRQEVTERIIFDARRLGPQNWAHVLDDILPLLFFLCSKLDLKLDALLCVVPFKTPGFIMEVLKAFGIELLQSDLRPRGQCLHFEVSLYRGMRAGRAAWAALPLARATVDPVISRGAPDLPRKVFLSRRTTRALENEAEVAAHLAGRGYETVYPEELSVPDQLRLFRDAHEIVAIHGAGLAPMIYADRDGPLRHLIEILPCGHMTDNFRGLAHMMGMPWIGVRGRIKSKYAPAIYDLDTPFLTHSLDSFEVDIASLDLAFDMLQAPMPEL